MPIEEDALGGKNDSVQIEIDGKIVAICEQYDVSKTVLRQPGALAVRIGSAQTAQTLISAITPRKSRYKLFINGVQTQAGIVYGVSVPSSAATIIEIAGRDYLSVVFDAYVREDKSFHEKTYKEFVRRILDEVGLTEAKGHKLITSNDVNRMKLTGRNVTASVHSVETPAQPKTETSKKEREAKTSALLKDAFGVKVKTFEVDVQTTPDLQRAGFDPAQQKLVAGSLGLITATPSAIVEQKKIDELKTAAATSGTRDVIVQTLKVQLGTRWYDAFERESKLVGLFLWTDAFGNFILARPNANQSPSFRLFRQRNAPRSLSNIIECQFQNDTTNRHTRAIVYGRVGKGKAGRNKLRGEFEDPELKDSNFDAPIVVHDNDIATKEQADYLARKTIAEERRSGWKLVYTVSGHTTKLISSADGASTNWAEDTVVEVDDQELGIRGNFYLESVRFRRAPTTTELTLMRPEDLVFAEDLFPKPIVVQRPTPKKPDAGVADPTSGEPNPPPAEPEPQP